MGLDGTPISLVSFLIGLLGIGMVLAGAIVAGGPKKDHYYGGTLMAVGLFVLAVGLLGPQSQ